METLTDAAKKAAVSAGLYMTADVRHSAMQHGWDSNVVANTHIMYDGSAYQLSVHEDFESQAMDLEYGTQHTGPTGVLRKYGNNTKQAEQAFIAGLEKNLGVKL